MVTGVLLIVTAVLWMVTSKFALAIENFLKMRCFCAAMNLLDFDMHSRLSSAFIYLRISIKKYLNGNTKRKYIISFY